ncbi:hypothetical protein BH24ACI3_BH24ACI3_12010 [soil metagenome]
MTKLIFAARNAAVAFIIIVFGSYVIVAQSELTGKWTASNKQRSPDKLYVSFELKTERGGKNQNGTSYEYSDLQGLTRDAAQNGRASFQIVREAGTIICEGTFTDGKGSGTFRFVPDRGYVDAMLSRGFDFAKSSSDRDHSPDERLFTAAMLNVKIATADDLRSSNFPNLDVDDLFKATIFRIDGRFAADMAATGYPELKFDDLVKARIFKIDAEYVRSIKDSGLGADNFEHLVKYKIFKITPEFLAELRNEGLTDLTPEEIVKLRIFKIDGAYVRKARSEDPNISIERMVQKKIGVRGGN